MRSLFHRFAVGILLAFAHSSASSADRSALDPLMEQARQLIGATPVGTDGSPLNEVEIRSHWKGDVCRLRLINHRKESVRVREVVLLDLEHRLPGSTSVYGEGFQMLSQTSGTLAEPRDVGSYTDRGHYRLPEPKGLRAVYGMLLLTPPAGGERYLAAFGSCRRFNGAWQFNERRLRAVLEMEDLELPAGESWELEDLVFKKGESRESLLTSLGSILNRNHPRLRHDPVPTGWCSWYCFGPSVTARNIDDNLSWIATHLPALRYIQIDDGYQPWMGDWLESGKAFGGDIRGVLKGIRQRGFEPALWVAPFIASGESKLFHEHPDWFVKDNHGAPLRSDKVGFGGWRLGPWYALDGTHPEAQRWLTDLFRTLRRDWGCTYFKLDATYWGTLPSGHRYDPHATRIEAYRRGMEAIRRGAGNALIMGCNHPIWPSLGLIHASRSSLDIERSWASFSSIGRENLLRGWQNGRLWWNDPDCVVLHDGGSKDVMDAGGKPTTVGKVPDHEYQFHATLIYATGGMLLSGDDLTRTTSRRVEMLKKLVPPSGVCARFENEKFEVGVTSLPDREMVSFFNWGETPVRRTVPLARKSRVTDYWTGEVLGEFSGSFAIEGVPGHSARLLEIRPVRR